MVPVSRVVLVTIFLDMSGNCAISLGLQTMYCLPAKWKWEGFLELAAKAKLFYVGE